MKKWFFIFLVIILAWAMVACALKENNGLPVIAPPDHVLPELDLADAVELSFKTLELTPLTEEKPKENWELIKSLPFGMIDNESVTLYIYKEINNNEANNNNSYIAQLKYQGHSYTLLDEVASSVLETTAYEINNDLRQRTSYLLQHSYGDKEKRFFLLGGIELTANGPGRVAYLVYDFMHNKWLQFEEWGIPYIEDLDYDKNSELIIQFPGLHMHFPDARIIRWNNGQLEESEDFQTALEIKTYQPSLVYMERDNNMYFSVEVNTNEDSKLINLAKTFYKYEKGKLIKVLE